MTQHLIHLVLLAIAAAGIAGAAEETSPLIPVGAARVDITPAFPVHLIGYANRSGETGNVVGRLHARALAIGADDRPPVVLITAEVCGITREISEAVVRALRQKGHRLERAHVVVAATHTHTGPAIRGLLPFSFGRDLPEDQAANVGRYTDFFQQKLIDVAEAALAARQPARLAWGEGRVEFAVQRRRIENGRWAGFGEVPGGPVDHALPVLRVADEQGALRAIFTSYACHCTSLGGPNVIHPDWAGEAAARLEEKWPGAVGLIGIGCGADAGPVPRGSFEAAAANGATVAAEVARLLSAPMRAIGGVTAARFREIDLPLDRAVPRAELEQRAAAKQRLEAYAAQQWLRELDAGRAPRVAVPYPVQAWNFGDALTMVFLGGEVVSEYSLRLRRELDGSRLWVNAYANDVSCYIPSRRMYPEGGYEVDSSIGKYGWPVRLAVGTEDRIIGTVRDLVAPGFVRRPDSR